MNIKVFCKSNLRSLAILFPLLLSLNLLAAEKQSLSNVLRLGNHGDPKINPQMGNAVHDQRVALALYEGLVNLDPQALKPIPGVAKQWTISPDGLKYTFDLREDAKWSNGDPVTSEDFVFAFERLLNPGSKSPHVNLLSDLKNAKAYYAGTVRSFQDVGISASTPNQLVLELERPVPYLLTLLAYHACVPLHKNNLLAHGDQSFLPENSVTNGPFMFKSWTINDKLVVAKNPFYWDRAHVYLDGIEFFPIKDHHTEYSYFLTGNLHVTHTVPADCIKSLLEKKDPCLRVHPYLSTAFYLINTKRPPLNDVRVRKALNLAINRSFLVGNILSLNQFPAYNLVPPGVLNYAAEALFTEDVQLAKQNLAEAGYPDGKGFPRLTLLYNTSDDLQLVAQFVQHQLKENLGIEIILENQEWGTFCHSRSSHQFDLCRGNWVGDYNDPTTFLDLFKSDALFNAGEWSSAEYDHQLSLAANDLDEKSRMAHLKAAEKQLMNEMPIIPLYFLNWRALVSEKVDGWYNNILDFHPYVGVSLKQN